MNSFGIFFVRRSLEKGTTFAGWVTTDPARTRVLSFSAHEDAVDFLCDNDFSFDPNCNLFYRSAGESIMTMYVIQTDKLATDLSNQLKSK